ncbi:MAG: hypothetical protein H0V17_07930, partial [Deltaproteobacteria bacterium]|nr:hypothetical protein [Deltaproteobacteria bacterium]
IGALDLPRAVQAVAFHLFELDFREKDPVIPLDAALASLLGHAALSIALVIYQVRRAQRVGVGGSS